LLEKGSLLIAEPTGLSDLNFDRSVILLVEHNESGSVGFILNKKLNYSTKDLIIDIKYKFPIYNGGPVHTENLYFIHNQPKLIPNSLRITKEIYWGGDFSIVLKLINSKQIKLDEIKFFLGYSGWDKNQLENEIAISSWVVKKENRDANLLLKNCDDIWKEKLLELGGKYLIWSNSPENPSNN
tara:strand:+ start:485 stop:1033 length:549 start_codon:yes stop_codon:yes gene_type:complete